MSVSVVTHLNFSGEARQALEFYHSVFGGQLMIGTYGEGGVPRDSTSSNRAIFRSGAGWLARGGAGVVRDGDG